MRNEHVGLAPAATPDVTDSAWPPTLEMDKYQTFEYDVVVVGATVVVVGFTVVVVGATVVVVGTFT